MLKEIHHSNIGLKGCLRRARELLLWPKSNAEVKNFVSKYSNCQSFQPEQYREDLQPHEMPSSLWSKVGADLFELGQQNFLILVDYWSSHFEVQEVKWITSTTVITAFKVQFARHGNPDVLIIQTTGHNLVQRNSQNSLRRGNLSTRLQVHTIASQMERQRTPLKFAKFC